MKLRTVTVLTTLFGIAFLLTACDSGVDTNDPPRSSFEAEVVGDYTVEFTNTSSDPDGDALSYEWDFGDGATSEEENPSHTFDENGPYDVTLRVTDNGTPQREDETTMEVDLDLTTFEVTVANTGAPSPILKSGTYDGLDEATTLDDGTNPLRPGEAYEVTFTAGPNEIPGSGMRFSFASMFIESNDIYYAPTPQGIPLFQEDGTPLDGANVTDSIHYYDAGTVVNQEPGSGEDGPAENGRITRLTDTDDDGTIEDSEGFEYPDVADGIRVTINSELVNSGGNSSEGAYEFTVRIENVSDETQTTVNGQPLTISPGSFAAHWAQLPSGTPVTYPSHEPGAVASEGIRAIAENGDPAEHFGAALEPASGVTIPLSPGAYAAHSSQIQVFDTLEAASEGVERIAEDGDPSVLVGSLQGNDQITDGGAFTTPNGAGEPGPLAPGQRYTFMVDAKLGDRLSFGTMHVQSNDAFYAFRPSGIRLFNQDGSPKSLDATDRVNLYDAGTEADEEPGVGLNQAPRQDGNNTGVAEDEDIRLIENAPSNSFDYPSVIQVTVSPQ